VWTSHTYLRCLPGALGFDTRIVGRVSAHSTLVLRRATEIHTLDTFRTPEDQRAF